MKNTTAQQSAQKSLGPNYLKAASFWTSQKDAPKPVSKANEVAAKKHAVFNAAILVPGATD